MKIKLFAFVAMAASVVMVSCKGDKGDLGPEGPAGPAGPQGPGAIYSSWTDINMTAIDFSTTYPVDEEPYAFKQVIAAPKLTADVADRGAVLMYYKNSEGTIVPINSDRYWGIMDKYDYDGDGVADEMYMPVGFTYKVGQVKLLMENWYSLAAQNSTGATVRYVLIPGTETGRVANLRKMSYKEVAKLYNIKD